MAWSVLQSAIATGGTGTAIQTYGSNLSSGSKLIAVITMDGTASQTISTVKDGAGNNFTQLTHIRNNSNGGICTDVWAMDTPAGDVGTTPTITATFSAAVTVSAIWIGEVSGLLAGTSGIIDGTAGTSNNGNGTFSTVGPPSYTSSASNEFLLYIYCDNGVPTTFTAPSGYTLDSNNKNNDVNDDLGVCYKNSTNGTETGSFSLSPSTFTASDSWSLTMFAIKLAATSVVAAAAPGKTWMRRYKHRQVTPIIQPPPPTLPAPAASVGQTWRRQYKHRQQQPMVQPPPPPLPPGTLPGQTWTRGFKHRQQQPMVQPPPPPLPPPSAVAGSTWRRQYKHRQAQPTIQPPPPASLPQPALMPGKTWRRQFKHPQAPGSFAVVAAGVNGTVQVLIAVYQRSRLQRAGAVVGAGRTAGGVKGTVTPTYLISKAVTVFRKPTQYTRAHVGPFGGIAGGLAGILQPLGPPAPSTVEAVPARRKTARAVTRNISGPVAQPLPYVQPRASVPIPRRYPSRAVTRNVAGPVAQPLPYVQPRASVPIPRRYPSRAVSRINAGPPPPLQQLIPNAAPGLTWKRRFHHPQALQPNQAPAVAPGAGQVQPSATRQPRRTAARALWRGIIPPASNPVVPSGQVQPIATRQPRRTAARAVTAHAYGTVAPLPYVQPRGSVPVSRRYPSRAVTRSATGATGAAVFGYVQPRASVPIPRRYPSRGISSHAYGITAPGPYIQPRATIQPRRTSARAVWYGTISRGTAVAAVKFPLYMRQPGWHPRWAARLLLSRDRRWDPAWPQANRGQRWPTAAHQRQRVELRLARSAYRRFDFPFGQANTGQAWQTAPHERQRYAFKLRRGQFFMRAWGQGNQGHVQPSFAVQPIAHRRLGSLLNRSGRRGWFPPVGQANSGSAWPTAPRQRQRVELRLLPSRRRRFDPGFGQANQGQPWPSFLQQETSRRRWNPRLLPGARRRADPGWGQAGQGQRLPTWYRQPIHSRVLARLLPSRYRTWSPPVNKGVALPQVVRQRQRWVVFLRKTRPTMLPAQYQSLSVGVAIRWNNRNNKSAKLLIKWNDPNHLSTGVRLRWNVGPPIQISARLMSFGEMEWSENGVTLVQTVGTTFMYGSGEEPI